MILNRVLNGIEDSCLYGSRARIGGNPMQQTVRALAQDSKIPSSRSPAADAASFQGWLQRLRINRNHVGVDIRAFGPIDTLVNGHESGYAKPRRGMSACGGQHG